MSGTLDIGPAEVTVAASAGAAVSVWVGDGADPALLDPVGTEGVVVTPGTLAVSVSGPYGANGRARVEIVPNAPALEVLEVRAGWEAPDGYGGAGLGRIRIPQSRDRRFDTEDLALTHRPVLSRAALPGYAPGVDAWVAWPTRGTLTVGAFWTDPSANAPYLFGRLDLTPLGALPSREDGDADGPRIGAGGSFALRRSSFTGADTWLAGDVWFGWRSIGVDGGWISRSTGGVVSDDQWVGGHARVVRLPEATDLFVAARVEWIDGIVVGETARIVANGRLSWRIHPAVKGPATSKGLDALGIGGPPTDLGDAWAAVYVEGGFSRESGPGLNATAEGTAVDLDAERTNDWITVGAWTRW